MSGKSELERTLAAAFDQDASIPPYEREFYFDREEVPCVYCEGTGRMPGKRLGTSRKCQGLHEGSKCRDGRMVLGRKWRMDFAWPERMLAVEVEGGTRQGRPCRACGRAPVGRHQTAKGFADDLRKYNAAALAGWLVLRFDRDMVLDGTAFQTVKEVFNGNG